MHCAKNQFIRQFMLSVLTIYKRISSSLFFLSHSVGLPLQCKFSCSCSEYARQEVESSQNLLKSCGRIMLRVMLCSPFSHCVTKSFISEFEIPGMKRA